MEVRSQHTGAPESESPAQETNLPSGGGAEAAQGAGWPRRGLLSWPGEAGVGRPPIWREQAACAGRAMGSALATASVRWL